MKLLSIFTLALCVPLVAQSKHKPKPLVCGPYQHVEHWVGTCGPSQCASDPTITSSNESFSCEAVCTPVPPDKCADDLHAMTEKEYQKLLLRIAILEDKVKSK